MERNSSTIRGVVAFTFCQPCVARLGHETLASSRRAPISREYFSISVFIFQSVPAEACRPTDRLRPFAAKFANTAYISALHKLPCGTTRWVKQTVPSDLWICRGRVRDFDQLLKSLRSMIKI